MSSAQFNIAMVLRADASQAKAGLAEVTAGLKQVSAEAGKTGAAAARQASELQQMAEAAGRAALSTLDLRSAATPVAAIWRATETAAESLRTSVAGLNTSMGKQAHDFLAARQEAALYQQMLDDVRASFNPLFAASRQYEQQLERIAEAERLGAISAREAAAARAQAAQAMAPASGVRPGQPAGASGISSMHTGNVAAQGFDIGVTAAMGMNPMMIGLQQGTQLVQVMQSMGGGKQALMGIAQGFMSILNPMSLATIGIVAFGAAGIQAIMSLKGTSKSAQQALEDLAAGVERVHNANAAARRSMADLAAEFGSAAADAKEFLAVLAEIERRSSKRDAKDTLAGIVNDFPGGSMMGLRSQSDRFSTLQRMFGESNWLTSGRISKEASPLSFAVNDALGTVEKARQTDDLDAQIAAVTNLRAAWEAAAAAHGGMSKEEDARLKGIIQAQQELQKLKAEDLNAAGNARADEMVRQLQQRIALEKVSIQFGRESAEFRAEENRQARETMLLELEKAGIARDSDKAREVMRARAEEAFAREEAAQEARRRAQREYLTGQDDQIAAMQRELSLLGASNEDRIRANALAEADLEIRRRSLSYDDAREAKAKAIAKAEAEITLERQKALRAVVVQSQADAFDGQIALARDPVSKANLEFQKAFAAQMAAGAGPVVAYAEALRARNRAMQDATTTTQTQIADMMSEVSIRRDLADQVAAGTLTSDAANRMLREELQLRPLIAAAARAEGAEKKRLLDLIEGMRLASAAMAAEDQRQSQNDYLRGQAERTGQLQLELSLLGQTADVRARVLAMVRAEQDIRRLGLTGDAADEIRRREEMNFRLAQTIEEQANAWERVQSAGEAAIDGVLDKLRGGDIKGALAEMLGEIEKGFFDLSIRNPLKNALLGTNLGTWGDIGGWSGVMGRLTGKNQVDERSLVAQSVMPVQAMTVNAATVTLAGNLSGIAGLAGGAANTNGAPMSFAGGLPGSADVQSQIWKFFADRGLQPHQIAGIMGQASAESSFNPLAVGDNGTSFGLWQHHAGRGQGLLDAVGGMGGLGNVNAQLEYLWKELLTSESGALQKIMASTNVQQATMAAVGFERPQGWSAANPMGAHNFDGRLAAAEAALVQFGNSVQGAGSQVDASGTKAATGLAQAGQGAMVASQGMGAFGQILSGIGGMVGGKTGSILSTVVGIGGALLGGTPMFKEGGFTGGSDPDRAAGVVHEGEFVFDAGATRRIGVQNLEGIRKGAARGFKSGGYVGASPAVQAANAQSAPVGRAVSMNFTVDVSGARGNGEIEAMVQQAVASGVSQGLDAFDREALPARVRQINSDRWGS